MESSTLTRPSKLGHHNLDQQLASDSRLQAFYWLKLTQTLDRKARALHGQGQLCTFPSSRGQEALFVGLGLALGPKDVYLPYYRDHGCLLQRDYSVDDVLLYWAGYEQANEAGYPQDFPLCVPIASQATHAVGAAWKLHPNTHDLVVCSLGDGATSKGDFYEALNFACVHKLRVLFVINSNRWAISTPFAHQSAVSLKDKLSGFGCSHVEEIDALSTHNVVNAVREVRDIISTASGPAILIAKTHRLDPHTVLDDFGKYADMTELESLREHSDPVHLHALAMCQSNPDYSYVLEHCTNRVKALVDESAARVRNFKTHSDDPGRFLFSDTLAGGLL